MSFREEVGLIRIRQGWREVLVLVLDMESHMTTLTWKVLEETSTLSLGASKTSISHIPAKRALGLWDDCP